MIRRMLIICSGLLIAQLSLTAQPYEHAAGVRAGYSSGITCKTFLRYSMSAFQLDGFYHPRGLYIGVQYLYHLEPFRSSRWLICTGGGPFSGQWEDAIAAGVSVTAGIEYNMRDLPLNFGIDWKPMLNIYKNSGTALLDFGASIRYRFSL